MCNVALLAEGVDRNFCPSSRRWPCCLVALLAEGVDRNFALGGDLLRGVGVALLAEGVDRNPPPARKRPPTMWSPSSRRAWIEMTWPNGTRSRSAASPSSRRAWIEISCGLSPALAGGVALLAEGVDRNFFAGAELLEHLRSPSSRRAWIEIAIQAAGCKRAGGRPPRGGRG